MVDLEARWETERDRKRVYVPPEDEAFAVEIRLPVAPPAAWAYLTAPQKRLLWQVDEIEQADAGGRRFTGTSSVCVDGRAKIYEEILDWRPFEYLTERTTVSSGLRLVLTTQLETDGDGTRIVTRGRRDGGGRLARLGGVRDFRRRLERRYERLVHLVAADIPEGRRLPLAAS